VNHEFEILLVSKQIMIMNLLYSLYLHKNKNPSREISERIVL